MTSLRRSRAVTEVDLHRDLPVIRITASMAKSSEPGWKRPAKAKTAGRRRATATQGGVHVSPVTGGLLSPSETLMHAGVRGVGVGPKIDIVTGTLFRTWTRKASSSTAKETSLPRSTRDAPRNGLGKPS